MILTENLRDNLNKYFWLCNLFITQKIPKNCWKINLVWR